MTVQVNFLPRAYQVRCRRSRRIQRWVVICAALLVAQGLSAHFLSFMARDTRETRKSLAAMDREAQDLNIQIARLNAQQRDLRRRLQLVERLGQKHRWSEVLVKLAGHMPETVTLTSLQTDPPKGQVVQSASTGQPGRPQPPKTAQKNESDGSIATGFLITGIATDHESVARFMRSLNSETEWGRCQLESTSRLPNAKGEAVTFAVRMRWQ